MTISQHWKQNSKIFVAEKPQFLHKTGNFKYQFKIMETIIKGGIIVEIHKIISTNVNEAFAALCVVMQCFINCKPFNELNAFNN